VRASGMRLFSGAAAAGDRTGSIGWGDAKKRRPKPGWRLETVDLRQMEGPAAVDDTPRSLRRCDPDQVPRDCLNPGQRDTPGGYITKLPNVFRAHQCPVTGQMHRKRACCCS